MSMYQVTNPTTGEVVKEYATATDEQVRAAVEAAHTAYGPWKQTSLQDRVVILRRVADRYEERAEELARLIAVEMGKPLPEGKGEVAICASIYRFYADNAADFLTDQEIEVISGDGRALVRKESVGVLLGIMPWNFPYYQVARFAGPNLALGNTILLKHAPQCPSSAEVMAQIFHEAGVPEGAYVNLYASNEQIEDVIADPRLQGVSLTGSERAGAAVAEIAGRNLKKVVLELGGSDPFLVLDDAPIEDAVQRAVGGRYRNAGQACNAAKRIIVADAVYDDFVAQLTESVQGLTVGDPQDEGTFMGPLSSEQAAVTLAEQVDTAVAEGAQVLVGGKRVEGDGAFFQPTVLAGVKPGTRAYTEELFGPVAVLYRVQDDDEAITLANDTPFGLGASVHSADPDRAARVAERLESGMVTINGASGTAAEMPFGGVKRSGFGRELGRFGMEEFCNHRLVYVVR